MRWGWCGNLGDDSAHRRNRVLAPEKQPRVPATISLGAGLRVDYPTTADPAVRNVMRANRRRDTKPCTDEASAFATTPPLSLVSEMSVSTSPSLGTASPSLSMAAFGTAVPSMAPAPVLIPSIGDRNWSETASVTSLPMSCSKQLVGKSYVSGNTRTPRRPPTSSTS